MADIEYDDSLLGTKENLAPVAWDDLEGGGKLSVANTPHLCVVKKIKGYNHDFDKYTGPRAKVMLQVIEGPDKGKMQHDDITLPHPEASQGSQNRRVLIASRIGLIEKGSKDVVNVNWKALEGAQVLITVEDKVSTKNGKTYANVTFDGWQNPAAKGVTASGGVAAGKGTPSAEAYGDI
jgi:hypothetical protein